MRNVMVFLVFTLLSKIGLASEPISDGELQELGVRQGCTIYL